MEVGQWFVMQGYPYGMIQHAKRRYGREFSASKQPHGYVVIRQPDREETK